MNKIKDTFKQFKKYVDKRINREKKDNDLDEISKLDDAIHSKDNTKSEKDYRYKTLYIFKFWLVGVLVAYLGFLLYESLEFIYLIFASYVISIAMESIINVFERRLHLPRGVGILLAYVLLFAFLISGFLLIIPFVLNQVSEIITVTISKIQHFQTILQERGLVEMIQDISFLPMKNLIIGYAQNPQIVNAIQTALQQNISSFVTFGTGLTKDFGVIIVNTFTYFVAAVYKILLTFVMALFFSLEKDGVLNVIVAMTGGSEVVYLKIKKLYMKLGHWLKGQIFLCIVIGVMVYALLYTLSFFGIDIPYKGTLALIAGITEFIPIIGPLLGALPALLVGFSSYGFVGLGIIAITYYLVQLAENNILVPRIMNIALGVSPLLIFIAMIQGGLIMGFVGVVLAVPLAVMITLAFEDFILKSNNNKKNK